jgi:hypothetical protein
MFDDNLLLIESSLKIRLPESYRDLHRDQADRLEELDWSVEPINPLYLTAEHVIAPNVEERQPEMGTACSFPNWWQSFFLIGTNGGGDYYALRLDNTEGVWLIGSDCGASPTRVAETLQQYVEQTVAKHKAAKALENERVRRRAPFQKEIDAHLAVVARDGGSLIAVPPGWNGEGSPLAAAWISCNAIYPMFKWLKVLDSKASPRKLRLFGLAICQLIPGVEEDAECMAGIALAKAMTLGTADKLHIPKIRSLLRSKIEHLMDNYRSFDQSTYRKTLWRNKAVYCLFQDDDEYLSDAPIYPNDPEMTRVQLVTLPVFSGFFDANCVNWGGLIETRVAENSHGAYPG